LAAFFVGDGEKDNSLGTNFWKKDFGYRSKPYQEKPFPLESFTINLNFFIMKFLIQTF